MRKILSLILILFHTLSGAALSVPHEEAPQRRAPRRVVHRKVAVTFDDLPYAGGGGQPDVKTLQEVTRRLVGSIASNNVPAIGFVNEGKLHREGETEARTAALTIWLDAGLELGNHTYAHPSLYDTPLAEFQEQIIRGEQITRRLLSERGMKLQYFRHPFLNTGPDLATKKAFEAFLAERGYTVAPVTIDNMEWLFADAYARAAKRGDLVVMRRVADAYVPYMEEMFGFYERLSTDLFGREIPQVLMLHANALNAERFGQLARMMKRRGYIFISLEEALKDKAYEMLDTYTGPTGISWLQRWAITRGQAFRKEPYLPPYVRQFDFDSSGSNYKTHKGKKNT